MVTVLTGSNRFLLLREQQKMVASFVQKHGDMAVEQLDGEEVTLERVLEAVQSLPFLASHKMVVLKNASTNKAITENIEHIIDSKNDTTDILIVEHQLDKRTVYYKTLKAKTNWREYGELDERQLAQWLVAEAKTRDGQLSSMDASYLVQRVGINQLLLSNELEKLINYDPHITRQSIDLLTDKTLQSTIFELLDAAFAGDATRALKLYQEQRQQKIEPLNILALIGWQLHSLAVVKTAGERSTDEIAKQARLNPFVVRKSQTIARRLTLARLKKLIHQALQLDITLKSQTVDADEALQNYLLTIGQ